MKFDFLDRRSAERFAELLGDTTGSRRHQQRQHSHGQPDERLAELIAIGHSLSAAKPGVRVDPEFRVGLRAMLVATAERDGIGRTATAVEAEPTTAAAARSGLRGAVLGQGGRRIRARGAIVIGVAAGAVAVSGISAASESASPGDALYGVKRSTERAQLAMAGSDVTRGQLSLDFARNRLAEAASMPGNAPRFAGVLDDMDADTRKGVRLLDTSAVARRDVKPLTTVDAFVAEQRRTLNPALGKLNATNRERAMASLSLLESISRRTDDLRAGLNCTPVVSAGSDALGPKLRDCVTTAGGTATSRPSGHSGKVTPTDGDKDAQVKPQRSAPAVAPDASADAVQPDEQEPATGPDLAPLDAVVPTTTSDAPDAGTDDDGLGGVLDKLFGAN